MTLFALSVTIRVYEPFLVTFLPDLIFLPLSLAVFIPVLSEKFKTTAFVYFLPFLTPLTTGALLSIVTVIDARLPKLSAAVNLCFPFERELQ